MSVRVLQLFPIFASKAELPTGDHLVDFGFEAPVGIKVTDLIFTNDALCVIGHHEPNVPVAFHSVIIIAVGHGVELPMGVELGRYLGSAQTPSKEGMRLVQAFQAGGWPTAEAQP